VTNKFNFAWQLARVQARKIKEVPGKIAYVLEYLQHNPNVHNYDRVRNWMRMTELGYKGDKKATEAFQRALTDLDGSKQKYADTEDNEVDLAVVSTADINEVLEDLAKRKYDFQFGSTPKDHTEFVETLVNELAGR
jgi:hypothetical protein